MSIWNKILVGLISVASLVFFYLAARTLKTEQNWAELAAAHKAKIDQIQKENERLVDGVEGDPSQPGLRKVRVELYRLMVDRRRVWDHCDPKIKLGDDGSAEVTVAFEQSPHGVASKTVLYAFEEADVRQKGRYMGEYAVTSADKQKATLVPTSKLNPREIEKLKTAKRPWVLYEMMPRDGHDVLATLSDEQKKAMLPADSLAEYLKDGKPAAKDDPPDRVIDGRYVRLLRDYSVQLNSEREKLILLNDSIEAAKRDKQLVVEARALALEAEEGCKRDIDAAVKERDKFARQRDVVAEHHKRLQDKLDAVLAEVAQLLETNKAMVGQLAMFQLEAAKRIDQRARAMAQTGTERL